MGMTAKDVASLMMSTAAAAGSLYLLYTTVLDRKPRPADKPPSIADKRRSHDARRAEVETLIMERGEHGTKDFRVHVLAKTREDETVAELSLWHDISLVAQRPEKGEDEGCELFNFICEIPKCTRKKFEVATAEGATPIKQDEKKGVLREFKKGDIFFNYGCFPRTWEDPRHISADTGFPGDNDPLDVCEIGLRQVPTGAVSVCGLVGSVIGCSCCVRL